MLLPGPLRLHLEVTGMFLLLAVGTVALYAPDIGVSRMRRHDLEPPGGPGLGRPSH
jgi:hypothetical protein